MRLFDRSRLPAVWTLFCLALSAVFIFDHLGLRAFWLDEAGSANLASLPWAELPAQAIVDGCPVLYALLLKGWSLIAGEGEFGLRAFSAFFALLCVWMAGAAAGEVFGDRWTAAWASFLAATSSFLIFFGTQNRVYTLAAFAGLVSFFYFIRVFRQPARRNRWGYGAASVFSLYLHPWLFLVFASQIISAFVFRRQAADYRRVLTVQVLVLLAALPNIGVTLFQSALDANAWMAPPTPATFFQSLGYMTFGSSAWMAGFTVLALAAGFLSRRDSKAPAKLGFERCALALYLLFPLLAAGLISQFSRAYVPGRYEMNVLPALLLLTAHIWAPLKRWPAVPIAAAAVLAVLAYQNVSAERRTIEAYRSTDKAVVQELLDRMEDGDVVIASDLSYSTASYYFRRLNRPPQAVRFDLLAFPSEIAGHPSWKNLRKMTADLSRYEEEARVLAQDLKRRTLGGRTVWVLYNSSGPVNPLLRRALAEAYVLQREESIPVPREPSWFDKILIFRH